MNRKYLLAATLMFAVLISSYIYYFPKTKVSQNIEAIFPSTVKELIKKTLFFYPEMQKKNSSLREENANLKQRIRELALINLNDSKEIYINSKTNQTINLDMIKVKEYQLPFPPYFKNDKAVGYISKNNDEIYLVTGAGQIYAFNKADLIEKEKIKLKLIKTNIKEIINDQLFFDELKETHEFSNVISVKDIAINNDKLYVSYTKKVDENCYTTAILSGLIKKGQISFSEIFAPNTCQSPWNFEDIIMSGGRMQFISSDQILITMGDYRSWPEAQNNTSIYGKTIVLNLDTGKEEIFTTGHRNPQGLLLDNETGLIYSSEHGPTGGDEVNVLIKGKNYGWPISSYGNLYIDINYPKEETDQAPTHKSHKRYGFEEPIFTASRYRNDFEKFFGESFDEYSGFSELAKVEEQSKFKKYGDLILTTMENKYIYFLRFDDTNKTVIDSQRFEIGSRVRDIVPLEENKYLLVSENQPSLKVMYLD